MKCWYRLHRCAYRDIAVDGNGTSGTFRTVRQIQRVQALNVISIAVFLALRYQVNACVDGRSPRAEDSDVRKMSELPVSA